LGITLWDTANGYVGGTSEEIVGRAVKKYTRQEDVVIATKVGLPIHDGAEGSGLSRRAVLGQVEPSEVRRGGSYGCRVHRVVRADWPGTVHVA
jgi:aryl-alcohol dehydrogenase-like predicted oxidoreductase